MPGPWAHHSREPSDPYTTKVGGLPDWPLPIESINPDLLSCAACASKLSLLAQLHAPISTPTHNNIQQRFLFILGCLTPKCATTSQSWRVLRVQKIHDVDKSQQTSATESSSGVNQNPNFLEDDNEGDMSLEELGKALFEAGTLASKTKTKKKKTPKRRQEKLPASSNQTATLVDNDIDIPVVPCFYIYTQEEPSPGDLSSVCSNYSSLSIKENKSDVEDHSQTEETWEKEHYEYDKALTADRIYLKFKKRLDAYPEQCFRYSYGGKPLLATAVEIDPGRCRLCGRPRQFEMQLMPPLLYFIQEVLDDDQRQMVENWDWMTLIVYTCSESCYEEIGQAKSNTKGWVVTEEAVVAQYEESLPIQLGYFS